MELSVDIHARTYNLWQTILCRC